MWFPNTSRPVWRRTRASFQRRGQGRSTHPEHNAEVSGLTGLWVACRQVTHGVMIRPSARPLMTRTRHFASPSPALVVASPPRRACSAALVLVIQRWQPSGCTHDVHHRLGVVGGQHVILRFRTHGPHDSGLDRRGQQPASYDSAAPLGQGRQPLVRGPGRRPGSAGTDRIVENSSLPAEFSAGSFAEMRMITQVRASWARTASQWKAPRDRRRAEARLRSAYCRDQGRAAEAERFAKPVRVHLH